MMLETHCRKAGLEKDRHVIKLMLDLSVGFYNVKKSFPEKLLNVTGDVSFIHAPYPLTDTCHLPRPPLSSSKEACCFLQHPIRGLSWPKHLISDWWPMAPTVLTTIFPLTSFSVNAGVCVCLCEYVTMRKSDNSHKKCSHTGSRVVDYFGEIPTS